MIINETKSFLYKDAFGDLKRVCISPEGNGKYYIGVFYEKFGFFCNDGFVSQEELDNWFAQHKDLKEVDNA